MGDTRWLVGMLLFLVCPSECWQPPNPVATGSTALRPPPARLLGLTQLRAAENEDEDEYVDLDEIPAFVVEAEARSAPARTPRIAALVGVSLVSLAFSVAHAGELTGQDVLLPSLFNNPALSCAVETAIGVVGAVLARTDIENRAANQQRIWDELKRRKDEMDGGNRDDRRRKKKEKAYKRTKEMKVEATASTPPAEAAASPTPAESAPAENSGGFLEALVDQAQQRFPEANALARSQAEKLNEALEGAGVLEPVGPGVDKELPSTEAKAPQPTPAASDAATAEGGVKAAPSKYSGKKKKKGKKRGRKKGGR